MILKQVESSNIAKAGFEGGIFVVEFTSGTQYSGPATQEEYEGFLKAASKGAYFARVFRSRMVKVEDDAA